MYHYTYLIQHKTENKRYIGVRSSVNDPKLDTNYWGSSKYLPIGVKETHVKIILQVFNTREEAVAHEIYLHKTNNVSTDNSYYNRAKQTSTKFDTTGTTYMCSEEKKLAISNGNKGKKRSKELAKIMGDRLKNNRPTEEAKLKGIQKRIENGKTKGIKSVKFKPWFISTSSVTYLFTSVTKAEQSIIDGHYKKYYADLQKKQNRLNCPVKTFKYGSVIIGELPKQYKI